MRVAVINLIMLFFFASFVCAERPMEELPMYGGRHDPKVALNKENSREAAKLGWQYYYNEDLDTAMKRFNQAWMFDHDNVDALWGFGIIMGRRASREDTEGNLRESIRFLEMANSKARNNYRITIDLAFSYTVFGEFLKTQGRSPESGKYFQRARELFKQAESIGSRYPLLYYNWSVLEFYEGNYQMAKARLDEAKELGFNPDPQYEEELKTKQDLFRQSRIE